jgi:hypothetical protein
VSLSSPVDHWDELKGTMYPFERSLDANARRSPDEVDALLRRFFRAQMPSPWPTFQPPAEPRVLSPVVRPDRWGQVRSRFALAAAIALLVLGSFVLSGLSPSPRAAATPEERSYFSSPRYEQQILNDQKAREIGVRIDDQGIILDEDGTAAIKVSAQPSK